MPYYKKESLNITQCWRELSHEMIAEVLQYNIHVFIQAKVIASKEKSNTSCVGSKVAGLWNEDATFTFWKWLYRYFTSWSSDAPYLIFNSNYQKQGPDYVLCPLPCIFSLADIPYPPGLSVNTGNQYLRLINTVMSVKCDFTLITVSFFNLLFSKWNCYNCLFADGTIFPLLTCLACQVFRSQTSCLPWRWTCRSAFSEVVLRTLPQGARTLNNHSLAWMPSFHPLRGLTCLMAQRSFP